MTSLLPFPELQFFDNDGNPLAGGTVGTYVPGTTTPKTTWQDAGQITANTSPIVTLDSSGRGIFFGVGSYRFIVKDLLGNLIYDQLATSALSESAISAAMLPVVGASTTASAFNLIGGNAAIATAISAIELLPGPIGPQGIQGIQGPTGPAGSAASEYAPGFVPSNPGYLQLQNLNGTAANCFMQFGNAATNSSGTVTVNFPVPFPNACLSVVATNNDTSTGSWWISAIINNTSSFRAVSSSPLHGGSWQGGPIGFGWIAIGY